MPHQTSTFIKGGLRGIEGDLPESWVVVNLGDFVENEKGKNPRNQQITRDSKYCFLYIDNDFLMVWDGSRSGLVGKGMDDRLGKMHQLFGSEMDNLINELNEELAA